MSTSVLRVAGAPLFVLAAVALGLADAPTRDKPSVKSTADVPAVVKANSDFALALYGQLGEANKGKNLFFSPYSLSTALAMVLEGARGETAEEMGKVLGFPEALRRKGAEAARLPWDTLRMHAGLAALSAQVSAGSKTPPPKVQAHIDSLRKQLAAANKQARDLRRVDRDRADAAARTSQRLAAELNNLLPQYEQYELRVANALWGEKTYPFRKAYLDTLAKYYRTGGLFPADFHNNPEGARQKINAWVAGQTRDRIKDLVGPGAVSDLTRLVLTNAVYFKGTWVQEFQADETRPDNFLPAGGGKVRVPMMRRDYLHAGRYAAFNEDGSFFDTPAQLVVGEEDKTKVYPSAQGFQMLELPYKGDRVALLVLAPRSVAGLASLEKRLTSANLKTWVGKLGQRAVHVYLPKFKLETTYDLGTALQALGMVRAFKDPTKPGGAEFGGMCASADPREQLAITKVLHKGFVEVTEKGTEAAAATAVLLEPKSAAKERRTVPFTPTFRADRPFVFLIHDRQTGSVLFLGRLTNPAGR
jgi:serine protease inhibitor